MTDVLIVDDHEDICRIIADVLEDGGLSSEYVTDGDQCLRAFNEHAPRLVLLDLWFKDRDLDGLRLLQDLKENNPGLPVIIISAHGSREIAVRAMRFGAFDFLPKPIDNDALVRTVRNGIEVARLRHENHMLKFPQTRPTALAGSSPSFRAAAATLELHADKNSRIMLTGQRGTGKRHAARHMHFNSARAREPFLVANFPTIDSSDAELALFGRQEEYGRAEPGLIEQAAGGTLYFDEVADIPRGVQRPLLAALSHSRFRRIGGGDVLPVDCRIVSGSSTDMKALIDTGKFNGDLYERLKVIEVELTPLDERKSDIEELADHFVDHFNREIGLPKRRFHPDTILQMTAMSWPGNVSQLKNMVERVLITGPKTGKIRPEEISVPESDSTDLGFADVSRHLFSLPLREAREEFERQYLIAQINRNDGNISKAAEFIGMERSALHRKLKGLEIVTTNRSGGRVAVKKG